MYDYIPKADVLTILGNLKVQKEPDTQDSTIIEAYKAGYRDALEQIRVELRSKDMRAKTLKLRCVVKEDKHGLPLR